jgi:hypothetical protein
MKKSREERLIEQNKLIAMQGEAEKQLLQIPGVVSVAVGLRDKAGVLTDEACFKVYVDKKKDKNSIDPAHLIPEKINGIPTDVIELGDIQHEADEKEYRPLCGGIQIQSEKSDGRGTLGCLAKDNTNNKTVILSNRHVLMDSKEQAGDLVGQPSSPCKSCCCECCFVAKIVRGTAKTDTEVDGAIAELANGEELNYVNEVLEIGPVSGTDIAVFGDTVRKRGRTTGLTIGTISSVNKGFLMDGVNYVGQIEVTPNPPFASFTKPGDSGSVYVNQLNKIVGLHFSGNGTTSNGNQIAKVLAKLNISIPDTGTALSVPLRSAHITGTNNSAILKTVTDVMEAYEGGAVLIEVIKKHRVEVMRLINTNREVKVAWHRYQGPLFMAHLMEKGKNPEYIVPEAVEGFSYQRLLLKMSVMLEKYGSQELASDIDNYSFAVFAAVKNLLYTEQCADLSC